jgi:hypothetical protein
MSKWSEIKSDFTDEDGTVFIDGFLTPDDNEEGAVIAKIKNGIVKYYDIVAKTDEYAQEVIKEVIASQIEEKHTMTVQNLIDKLNEVEDKSKPIFGYININGDTYEVVPIIMVDDTISDRVDINLEVDD